MGKWWWRSPFRTKPRISPLVAGAVFILAATTARPGIARDHVPEWLHSAAAESTPAYPAKTEAVVLLDREQTSVEPDGTMVFSVREAIKILRPRSQDYWALALDMDSSEQIESLKGWAISAQGQEFAVGEKDAIDLALFPDFILYEDERQKVLDIPAPGPGSVIGYEYREEQRPYTLHDAWRFQRRIPVVQSQYSLQLPQGWEYKSVWINHAGVAPQSGGANSWTWQVRNVPAIDTDEPLRPPGDALEGEMGVLFYPPAGASNLTSPASWKALGLWQYRLALPQRAVTPAIRQEVAQLTAAQPDPLGKIRAIASFVQQDVRYVAVELGIGGYKPNSAADILTNLYGDCKDKATLLSAMLSVIGVKSYYVVVNADHGEVHPDFPSADSFDHMILAIALPKDVPATGLCATVSDPQLGTLLIFDPTDRLVPLGYLPAVEQGNYALLVKDSGGDLIQLPVAAPDLNHVLRRASITISPAGDAVADVQEDLRGAPAFDLVGDLMSVEPDDRERFIKNLLGRPFGQFQVASLTPSSIPVGGTSLALQYRVNAADYARTAGDLMLLHPHLTPLPGLSPKLLEEKDRQYPVQFPRSYFDADSIVFNLPSGYQVQGVPPPLDLKTEFGEYKREVKLQGNRLDYSRTFELAALRVPRDKVGALVKFLEAVNQDSRLTLLLRKTGSPQP